MAGSRLVPRVKTRLDCAENEYDLNLLVFCDCLSKLANHFVKDCLLLQEFKPEAWLLEVIDWQALFTRLHQQLVLSSQELLHLQRLHVETSLEGEQQELSGVL